MTNVFIILRIFFILPLISFIFSTLNLCTSSFNIKWWQRLLCYFVSYYNSWRWSNLSFTETYLPWFIYMLCFIIQWHLGIWFVYIDNSEHFDFQNERCSGCNPIFENTEFLLFTLDNHRCFSFNSGDGLFEFDIINFLFDDLFNRLLLLFC